MHKTPKHREPIIYSFRVTDEVEAAIERHFQRLTEAAWPGVRLTRTDAIASLLIVGGMAWDAADRSGPNSPGALIEAGERACAEAWAGADPLTDDENNK